MAETKGITVTLRQAGAHDVERQLARVTSQLERPRALMKAVGAVLESSARKRFRTGVGPDGVAWKPSARAKAKGGRTLLDFGHLRDSITHEADDSRAVIGSNLVYAAIHQVGGVIRAKAGGFLTFKIPGVGWRRVRQVTIPARPYLGVSEADRREITAQGLRFIGREAGA